MNTIHREKLAQAQAMLEPGQVWLIATRESLEHGEPGLALLSDADVTWDSFFLVTRSEAVAIVGRFDADAFADLWSLRPYDADPGPTLWSELERLNARAALVNYSTDDPLADGLTHGMFLRLRELAPDLHLESASAFLGALRGRKTLAEQEAIREAVHRAERDLEAMTRALEPGWTERQVAAFLHDRLRPDGLEPSWGWHGCPNVHFGPQARPSHAGPTDRVLEAGMLVHIDYGVRLAHGYCSDIQRTYYFRRGQENLPKPLLEAFTACWNAIEEAAKALRPGVRGFEVDAASRSSLVASGYGEYLHAVGHGLGRATHDGGTLLGPRWPRYGSKPEGIVSEGEVYTLELGTFVEGFGYVGLEEDVVVRSDGLEWLSNRQNALIVLG